MAEFGALNWTILVAYILLNLLLGWVLSKRVCTAEDFYLGVLGLESGLRQETRRWHFLLRSPSPGALGAVAAALGTSFKLPSGDVRLALDRDPVALL